MNDTSVTDSKRFVYNLVHGPSAKSKLSHEVTVTPCVLKPFGRVSVWVTGQEVMTAILWIKFQTVEESRTPDLL
jgi:hypothetical protein